MLPWVSPLFFLSILINLKNIFAQKIYIDYSRYTYKSNSVK